MYERPSMPRPPYIRVGAEAIISPRGSVFASSTLREQQSDMRSKVSLPSNAPPPTQAPTGQPCSTGVGNNPLTIPEHSQRAVSRMPKARRSRLSLTRCAGCATFPNHKLRRQRFVVHPNSAMSTLFDRGWQQPLDHPGAQPACRVKDAEGTAQPLVLDSVRWLGYSPKSQAAPPTLRRPPKLRKVNPVRQGLATTP